MKIPIARRQPGTRMLPVSGGALRRSCYVLVAAGILATACSNSPSTGGSGDGPSAPGISANSIKLGLIASYTGPLVGNFSTVTPGFDARIALQNAQGGIDGRKITYVKGDDTGTAAGALTAAQTLVQQDNVFAVASVGLFTFAAEPYLRRQGVPVVGAAFDATEWVSSNSNMFPTDGSYGPSYPAPATWGKFFKQLGVTRLGIVSINVPSGSAAVSNFTVSAKAAGISVPYTNDTIPLTQLGNFQSIIQSMQASHVDGVYVNLAPQAALVFKQEAQQAGLKSKVYLTPAEAAASSFATGTAHTVGQGLWATFPYVPPDHDTPATTALKAALSKYEHQATAPDRQEYEGWISADLLIKGLQLAGPNPTRAKFISSLRAVNSYSAGGLELTPVSFTASFGTGALNTAAAPGNCSYFVQYEGFNWVSQNAPICGPILPHSNGS
jgi:branched-chain amino acid transport system substrate-binding protein